MARTQQPPPAGETPQGRLARLINEALATFRWSPEQAAQEAIRLSLTGPFAVRSIRQYSNAKHKRVPKDDVIRCFARLFGESEDEWLEFVSDETGTGSLLLDHTAILRIQEQLQAGDRVILISSRRFLENDDPAVAKTVQDNLDRGIVYIYCYPHGSLEPHGSTAAESFSRVRKDTAAQHRFSRPPYLFGYSIEAARFRFFSGLHSIVRIDSQKANLTRAYAYVEIAKRFGSDTVQGWYPLPESVWKEIESELHRARIADDAYPILPLNPNLRLVRDHYVTWFCSHGSVDQYTSLRPILGHSGKECVDTLLGEVAMTDRLPNTIKYLDIGCGDGVLTHAVASQLLGGRKIEVTGLDISRCQLDAATTVFKSNKSKSITFTPRVEAFEAFETKEVFNIVTAIHSLYVVDEAYVYKVFQLLAPGGTAFIWLASRNNNVITSVTDAVDGVLRKGQRRHTAEDIADYARHAGLLHKPRPVQRMIPSLLTNTGKPSDDGNKVINFCALRSVQKRSTDRRIKDAWDAAVEALRTTRASDGQHPLHDGLIIIQRHQ